MSALKSLENSLDDVFAKQAPALPTSAKKIIVEWTPWVTLVVGLLSLWAAWGLWNWAHVADRYVDFANQLSATYGGPAVATSRLSTLVWLSLAVMVLQAVLYIVAFPALKARKKSGWNLLFYALLVNIVYGVVSLFSDYGGAGNLIGSLIGSAIGFYFLFQIRASYLGTKTSVAPKV